MTTTRVTLIEASQRLADLIDAAERGDQVLIEADGKPVVQLVLVKPGSTKTPALGAYRGMIRVSEDFNEPMADDALLRGQP